VKSKQKRRNPNKNPGNPDNKKQIFCLDFTIFLFEFPGFLFGFPGFLKESEKSKLKNSEIQTKSSFFIPWISPILCLGFPDLSLDFALFIFGFR
jgi:hypothetical protein